ncbi:hypothetical protein P4O66_011308 [Electrophorus voltai]|uniref:Uncharacterized protein n=1 Tax=Electrophorus voltai TaxID=2609070 RepID=A0AAD8ZAW2_9TELE|nr:hypothetical protein P4O66_011308 [Electrophorus voltai]
MVRIIVPVPIPAVMPQTSNSPLRSSRVSVPMSRPGSYDPYMDNQFHELDSAGTYNPYMDYQEGYADHGESREYSDVSFQSDSEFNHVGDPLMEVEEILHKDPPSVMDTASADSKSDKPSTPKAPPRVSRSGASKLPHMTHREAASSSHQNTPLPKEHSPRAHAPMAKPRRGKREVSPLPAPEREAKQLVRLLASSRLSRKADATRSIEGRSPTGQSDFNPADNWGTGC